MTGAVPRLVLINGAQMKISVEMTKLGDKTQFSRFIYGLFLYFFVQTHGVDTLWYISLI